MQYLLLFVIKYIFNPVLVGLILYGGNRIGGESGIRVAIAISIITTSYLFLSSISRFPWVGCYTNMLTKVYSYASIYCTTYLIRVIIIDLFSGLCILHDLCDHVNVHFLQVMSTITKFFFIYLWHLMAYAIGFHILLPGNDAFSSFVDAIIKVRLNAKTKFT